MKFPDVSSCRGPIDFAVAYAEAGIPVFPVEMVPVGDGQYRKRPHKMLNDAPRGEGGFKLATVDVAVTRGRWEKDPDAAIGWFPGGCGLVVIDADGPEGVRDLFNMSGGELDNSTTVQIRTSGKGGGRHVVFDRSGAEGTIRNGSLVGIVGEARGDMGYGMLPDGRDYYSFDCDTFEVAALPKWAEKALPLSKTGDGQMPIVDVTGDDERVWVEHHTAPEHSPAGRQLLERAADVMEQAVEGDSKRGRHPSMVSAVAQVLSHAQNHPGRDLNLADAHSKLRAGFLQQFADSRERQQRGSDFDRFWSAAVALRVAEGDTWVTSVSDETSRQPDGAIDARSSRMGFAPDDLQAIVDGGLEPIEPEVFFRRDAQGLLYKEKLNVIFGAPEAGKTWCAVFAAVERINDAPRMGKGVVVVFFDFEDDGRSYLLRMQAAGANLNHVIEHSRHYTLDRPVSQIPFDFEGVDTAELIVVDTTNSAMTLADLDPLNNKDALVFINDVRRLRKGSAAAWLLLDHEPISTKAGRRQAIGAQSKLGAVDGAQYRALAVKQPRPGAKGAIALYLTKDRPGGVRKHAGKPDTYNIQHAGTIMLDPINGSDEFRWELIEPQGTDGDTELRVAIVEVCDDWLSRNQIRDLVRGQGVHRRHETIDELVLALAESGTLRSKPKSNYVVYKAEKDPAPTAGDHRASTSPQYGATLPLEIDGNTDDTTVSGSPGDPGETRAEAPRPSPHPLVGREAADRDRCRCGAKAEKHTGDGYPYCEPCGPPQEGHRA